MEKGHFLCLGAFFNVDNFIFSWVNLIIRGNQSQIMEKMKILGAI